MCGQTNSLSTFSNFKSSFTHLIYYMWTLNEHNSLQKICSPQFGLSGKFPFSAGFVGKTGNESHTTILSEVVYDSISVKPLDFMIQLNIISRLMTGECHKNTNISHWNNILCMKNERNMALLLRTFSLHILTSVDIPYFYHSVNAREITAFWTCFRGNQVAKFRFSEKLLTLEALYIEESKPELNTKDEYRRRTLKLKF